MKSDNITIRLFIGTVIILVLLMVALNKPNETTPQPNVTCNEDSLRSEIVNLQGQIEQLEDGFDKKERRYEDVLFEYEYGLDRIKETHPSAYKEFHRIISYKERYTNQDKIENEKRLNIYEHTR
jgi:hypothetical protein